MHWTICTHTPWSRNFNSFILVSNDFPPARAFAMLELDRQCNVSPENSAEHETLSLSLPTTLSRQFVQQVTRNSVSTTTVSCQVTQTRMMTRTDKDWHFVVGRYIKPVLSFRGHFSCGNSRISSNNKSYNLPFCEQLIALQMCINQNPASLTVLPDTSSTT